MAHYAYKKKPVALKWTCLAFTKKIFLILLAPIPFIKAEPPNIRIWPNKQSVVSEGTKSKEEDKRQDIVCWNLLESMEKNVHSKTKELAGTLAYAFSRHPAAITASSDECQNVITAGKMLEGNVALRRRTVWVQTRYH